MFFETFSPPEIIHYDDGKRSLIMRRASAKDAQALVDALELSLDALHSFMPWSHFPALNTVEAQTDRLRALEEKWDKKEDFGFQLFLPRRDGSLSFVGCLGLHPRCLHNQGREIGYWVRTDVSGRGICTLATQLMVLAGFQLMKLKRIQIVCDENNMGSRRVIDKVGFHYEGLQRNMSYGEAPEHIKKQGWIGSGNIRCYGLIPEDLASLGWVETISRSIRFEERLQTS